MPDGPQYQTDRHGQLHSLPLARSRSRKQTARLDVTSTQGATDLCPNPASSKLAPPSCETLTAWLLQPGRDLWPKAPDSCYCSWLLTPGPWPEHGSSVAMGKEPETCPREKTTSSGKLTPRPGAGTARDRIWNVSMEHGAAHLQIHGRSTLCTAVQDKKVTYCSMSIITDALQSTDPQLLACAAI